LFHQLAHERIRLHGRDGLGLPLLFRPILQFRPGHARDDPNRELYPYWLSQVSSQRGLHPGLVIFIQQVLLRLGHAEFDFVRRHMLYFAVLGQHLCQPAQL
jgi:hypothetical protein